MGNNHTELERSAKVPDAQYVADGIFTFQNSNFLTFKYGSDLHPTWRELTTLEKMQIIDKLNEVIKPWQEINLRRAKEKHKQFALAELEQAMRSLAEGGNT